VFVRMLLPAPAGSVLAGLPQREPLELVRGAVHPHALARVGRYYATLPRGPLAGAFAFCLCGDSPGPARPDALHLCGDSPPSRTRRCCARSTCAMCRSGSRRRRRRPRLPLSTRFGSWRLQSSRMRWRCGSARARTSTGCRVFRTCASA
jgi:hypothetical protein